ncbi:hypothetical protein ACQKWADRAFT_24812 [Trichoderma austrokoningii]
MPTHWLADDSSLHDGNWMRTTHLCLACKSASPTDGGGASVGCALMWEALMMIASPCRQREPWLFSGEGGANKRPGERRIDGHWHWSLSQRQPAPFDPSALLILLLPLVMRSSDELALPVIVWKAYSTTYSESRRSPIHSPCPFGVSLKRLVAAIGICVARNSSPDGTTRWFFRCSSDRLRGRCRMAPAPPSPPPMMHHPWTDCPKGPFAATEFSPQRPDPVRGGDPLGCFMTSWPAEWLHRRFARAAQHRQGGLSDDDC